MSAAEAEQYHQFQAVFRAWYGPLCNYALTFTKDPDISEDIVQDLFVKIWEQRRGLLTETSIRYYLFTAVRNNCITWLRREKQQIILPFSDDQAAGLTEDEQYPGEGYPGGNGYSTVPAGRDGSTGRGKPGGPESIGPGGSHVARVGKDELTLLREAIDLLPPKCREIFLLSRFSKLSYKEIAASLEISPKTVENQLSKALRLLRAYLKANGVGLVLILALIFP
ncbi:MAG: RNA polymerase sigma-70 factor [Bacteroidetes bacterium]|nr:RNA polymerase sigma-70 factor [Bacteroidota bacterium]